MQSSPSSTTPRARSGICGAPSSRDRIGWRRVVTALGVGLVLVAGASASRAADENRAFFDAYFGQLMDEEGVPGAAVVVVQRGQVVFQAGYGWTDLSRRTAVDPERTIFPLGSIAKIFTTIAALQLVEAGRLDLDADLQRYLGEAVRLDRRFAAPITLRHLLTHTDGFDPRWLFGAAARVPGKVRSLDQTVALLPPRLLPPGELYLYSDVGMTLAGYLVERTTNEPFSDYMDRHVLLPLGMTRTSFRPDRPDYARERATGYDYTRTGRLIPVTVAYAQAVPASGVTAAVSDLAALMNLLLGAAPPDGNAVLTPRWREEMAKRQFTHHPEIPGTGYGFYEYYHHGQRALVHGGLVPGFSSVMVLLPEQQTGLFVAANLFDLTGAFERVLAPRFIDRFAPGAAAPPARAPTVAADLQPLQVEGLYRSDQYSRFSSDKLAIVSDLVNELRVSTQPDGRLRLDEEPQLWRPIGPRLYEQETTGERIAFRLGPDGRADRIVGSAQFMSYHRLGWFERQLWQATIGGTLALLSGLAGFGAFWSSGRAWFRDDYTPGRLRLSRRLMTLLGALVTAFVLTLGVMALRLTINTAVYGEPLEIRILQYLSSLIAVLAVTESLVALSACFGSDRRWREPLLHLGGAAAAFGLLPVLAFWNLLHPLFTKS